MPEREQGLTAPKGLIPVGSSGELKANSSNPEVLDPATVEIRFGNPETDASLLLEFYLEETTREHLQGIVPFSYTEETRDPRTGEITKREKILATTVDDIRNRYKNPNLTLLTAETPSGLIVGACNVEKKSPNVAEIGGLVVPEKHRGNRYIDRLIRTANAFIFREGSGGLDCSFAEAFVIIGTRDDNRPGYYEPLPAYHVALNGFRRQGFEGRSDRRGATRSWSNQLNRLVDRVSQPVELTKAAYKHDFPRDHIKYFPTLRPPRQA